MQSVDTDKKPRRKRGRRGLGCLITLIIVVIVVVAGWFLALRPYLHNMAEQAIDRGMSSAINQIPPQIALLPISSVPIQETSINNMIVLNSSPASPLQNTAVHITPSNVELAFQVYGLPCSISQVPRAENGQLVATNVSVNGVLGLIMSPDEMTTILNNNYAKAQGRLHHQIQNAQLKDHEMDLQLGKSA
jgi:hypothetical protein